MTKDTDITASRRPPALAPGSGRDAPGHSRWWFAAALGVALLVALGLRVGTRISALGQRFDEPWTRQPIEAIVAEGWSVRTAIDFEETKGPAFVWPYAAMAEVLGGELARLRLTTVLFFVLGAIPLLVIARRCGVTGIGLTVVAILYCLLPQHAVLGQLLMSEAGFVLGSLLLTLVFLWGFGVSDDNWHPLAGPILFGLLLAVLLHHRIHAVAFAPAACLLAWSRFGRGSWPWWCACALAGASRIPLWIRWGGLVSPDYQDMHALAGASGGGGALLSLGNATYLAAALVPWTAVFLVLPRQRSNRVWIAAGAILGLALAVVAPPRLDDRLPTPAILLARGDQGMSPYLGLASSVARTLSDTPMVQSAMLGAMAVIGLAGLGALAGAAWSRRRADQPPFGDERGLARFVILTLLAGIGLYALTRSFVLDRYLLPWAAAMPVLWWRLLPRGVTVALIIALAAMTAAGVARWLW